MQLACLFLLDAPGQQQSLVNTHFGPSIIVVVVVIVVAIACTIVTLLVVGASSILSSCSAVISHKRATPPDRGIKAPGCTILTSFVSNLSLIARNWLSLVTVVV